MVSFELPHIDIPWPTHMDYAGQGKAEKIFQIIIMVFAGVGFVWGYMCQQVSSFCGACTVLYCFVLFLWFSTVLTIFPIGSSFLKRCTSWLLVSSSPAC